MSWLIKRIFSEKTVGYLVEIARPKIKEVMQQQLKENVIELLADEEVAEMVTQYGDALYDRYRRKVIGTMGGLQKGLNSVQDQQTAQFDPFDEEGRLSIKKILPLLMKGSLGQKFGGIFGGGQGQSTPQSGDGGQNAPNM